MASLKFAAGLGVAAMWLATLADAPAQAQIDGFHDGVGFTVNHTSNIVPVVSNLVFQATDDGIGEALSIYYNTKQDITNWTADFTYRTVHGSGSDGFTFNLQNQGLTALGNDGAGLGYGDNGNGSLQTGITPSAAIVFNIVPSHGIGTNFATDGADPLINGYLPTGNVDISSGDPIAVHLVYDGATLRETLTDTVTNAVFQTSYQTNLVSVLGGSTAYVGFTGATGGGVSVQQISDFEFTPGIVTETLSSYLLWNNVNGQAALWAINSSGSFSDALYGPFSGWTAQATAAAPDASDWLLWTNTNGQASLWNVTALTANGYTHTEYGPYPGYKAVSVSVGSDGKPHLLWDKSDSTASLWNVDFSAGTFTYTTYGPYSGWKAVAVSAAP